LKKFWTRRIHSIQGRQIAVTAHNSQETSNSKEITCQHSE